ncbi:MAG: carboxymuconolactone decarboxylase family protein [Edaphobacter sp.]
MSTEARIDYPAFNQFAPAATAALSALSKAASDSGLDKQLIELIKIRASQINGCAFCLQYHLNVVRKTNLISIRSVILSADSRSFIARGGAEGPAVCSWCHSRLAPFAATPCALYSHRRCLCHQRVEQNCNRVSRHASDTTRQRARIERNVPACAKSFVYTAIISLLHREWCNLNFLRGSIEKGHLFRATIEPV